MILSMVIFMDEMTDVMAAIAIQCETLILKVNTEDNRFINDLLCLFETRYLCL